MFRSTVQLYVQRQLKVRLIVGQVCRPALAIRGVTSFAGLEPTNQSWMRFVMRKKVQQCTMQSLSLPGMVDQHVMPL